ncbi:MAG: hypothetical protein KatS3mg022_1291 [Armatimonadota bacterium]|nr:MAG: hypothetical protein KatS3mg022_1291 [Armatimonadota bacterium]
MEEIHAPEPEDPEAEEAFHLLLTRLTLEQCLRSIPDGVQWLQLVLAGHSAWEATTMLRRSRVWLQRVREACRRALEDYQSPYARG